LVNTCSQFCKKVFHVEDASGLSKDWFKHSDNVGITAGTSTPDRLVEEVEQKIKAWFAEDTTLNANLEITKQAA
jgi:4-hydroxy-3-methylbut-2-enyl diphosphate reductase